MARREREDMGREREKERETSVDPTNLVVFLLSRTSNLSGLFDNRLQSVNSIVVNVFTIFISHTAPNETNGGKPCKKTIRVMPRIVVGVVVGVVVGWGA